MRKITVFRQKHFAGCISKYYCVIDVDKADFVNHLHVNYTEGIWVNGFCRYSDAMYPISNGKEITFEIDTWKRGSLFVVANTSSGMVYSNEVTIEAGSSDLAYLVVTKYDWRKGSQYLLTEKSSLS